MKCPQFISLYTAKSMKEYIRTFSGNQARFVRPHYNRSHGQTNPMPKLKTLDHVKKFINPKTLYPILNNIVYGWLKPKLEEIDEIRLSVWCRSYGMDASEKTIPVKFAPQTTKNVKHRLNASCNHICCDWGYHIGYTRLLEKGGESYEVMLVEQLANTIALNMSLVKKCDDFHIILSLDNASNSNIENVRNCIIQGICRHLAEYITNQYKYTNRYGVKFDFREFRLTVMYIQFSFISFHRIISHFMSSLS